MDLNEFLFSSTENYLHVLNLPASFDNFQNFKQTVIMLDSTSKNFH